MADFIAKPTNKKPVGDQSKNYEKNFNKVTTMHGLNLNEVDGLLTEKEMSFKKKIFSLPKMEALVHPDPKLSAVYNKMAEDGEEKYGYHYNETIMNIIFNDYVLNSPKYLQKYKMAVPKKKKRRDKSGIRQLQKAAEKKIKDSKKNDMNEDIGGIRVKFLVHPDDPEVFAYFPDENHDASGKYKIGYSHIGQHSAVDPQYAAESRPATPEEYEDLKDELEQHVGYTLDIIDEQFGIKPTQNPLVHGGEVIDTGKAEGKSSEDKKLKNAKVKSVTDVGDLDETSTTGSVGGSGMGSGGYVTPHAWGGGDLSKGMRKQKPPIQRKPIWKGGTIIAESNYLVETEGFEQFYNMLNENDIDFINRESDAYGDLENMGQEDINIIKKDIEMGHLDEKSTSKKQQRFMGMVRGVQKGDVNPKVVSSKVRKVAKEMKPEDVKDFAGTKHDKLPEKINEHHLTKRLDKIKYIINTLNTIDSEPQLNKAQATYIMSMWDDSVIDRFYKKAEAKLIKLGIDPMSIQINEENMNEHHLSTKEDKIRFLIAAQNNINPENSITSNESRVIYNAMLKWDDNKIDYYYKRAEAKLMELGIDPMSITINEETDQTMIGANTESMANKPRPEGEFGGGVPMGMQDSGGLRESEDDDIDDLDLDLNLDVDNDIDKDAHKMDWDKIRKQNEKPLRIDRFMKTTDGREMFENEIFDQINEELEAFSIHHDKLKSIAEERKPSALVLRDRLGKENESNFKSDMQKSVTKDVTKMEKDIMWKDQQTKVGDNPYKAGEDLEKAAIKATEGNALKNVGDSDGTKGEIPKRNLTTKEQEEVDLYRLGQQDIVYDNQPNEKFEERMKAGMGDEMYEKRQEKLKKRAERPLYNKEAQPIQDTAVDKVQFNKEKSGWNEREGLKESVLTGKYVNELNKRKLVDFKLSDVKIVESVNNMFKIDFTGMGNSVDSRGNVNEAVDNVISSHKFYTDGKTVVAIKNPIQKLNEGDEKPKQVVSEEVDKMKHLLGYDPKKYVDTKRNKI